MMMSFINIVDLLVFNTTSEDFLHFSKDIFNSLLEFFLKLWIF